MVMPIDHRVLLREGNARHHLTEEKVIVLLAQVVDGEDHHPILIQTDWTKIGVIEVAVEIEEMIVEEIVEGTSHHQRHDDGILVVGVKIHHRNLLIIEAGQNLYLIVIDNNIIGQSQSLNNKHNHHHYHNQRILDPIHQRIHLRLPRLHIAVVPLFP